MKTVALSVSCLLFAAAAAVAGELDLNPLNGALELERADLVVGEGNAAYTLLRSHQPVLGRTWHWSCDSRLALDSGDGVLWIDETGSAVGMSFMLWTASWISSPSSPTTSTLGVPNSWANARNRATGARSGSISS